jgi:redox-sensitive bicupin YhaK (pirin superfamily)
MDQMGEVDYVPGEPKGTPLGSHRGFETVTDMIDGVFRHQDSNGGGGLIADGDTQWMTVGGPDCH